MALSDSRVEKQAANIQESMKNRSDFTMNWW